MCCVFDYLLYVRILCCFVKGVRLRRSLAVVTDSCVLHLVNLLRQVRSDRQSYLFRLSHFCREIESYVDVLDYLVNALDKTERLLKAWPSDEVNERQLNASWTTVYRVSLSTLVVYLQLMPVDIVATDAKKLFQKVMNEVENVDPTCFFGRPIGFQVLCV